jgi:hypothetical protein
LKELAFDPQWWLDRVPLHATKSWWSELQEVACQFVPSVEREKAFSGVQQDANEFFGVSQYLPVILILRNGHIQLCDLTDTLPPDRKIA